MRYPDNQDKVIFLDRMDVNCSWSEMFEWAATNQYYKLFDLFINRAEEYDYNIILASLISNVDMDVYVKQLSTLDILIKRFLCDFDCDVNYDRCPGDFEYIVQQCLYHTPKSVQYFLTEQLDVSIINNEEFWSEFCAYIEEQEQYKDALIHLKQSGLAIDESLMLDAFNEADLTELVDAYQSA